MRVDQNGFVKDTTDLCSSCHYTKMANGRVRRITICPSCKAVKPEFEGTWSADLEAPAGTRGGFEP